jgi:GT2 family glycosyltransferase/glycosyltransferase involved in cell wall biosynthesis
MCILKYKRIIADAIETLRQMEERIEQQIGPQQASILAKIDGIESQINFQKQVDALNADKINEYNNFMLSPKRIKVFTHELSNTGAPLVLADIIEQWVGRGDYPKDALEFISLTDRRNDESFVQSLAEKEVSFRNISYANTSFKKGDIVVLNTIVYPEWLLYSMLHNSEIGRIEHIFIYSHEHIVENMIPSGLIDMLSVALTDGRATIYVSNQATLSKYREVFRTGKNILLMPNRFDLEADEFAAKSAEDFERIEFIAAGTTDIRKGQLDIIYAYLSFYHNYYKGNESKYRDFRITIAGVDRAYPVFEVYADRMYAAAKGLGDHARLIGYVPLDELMTLMRESNVSVLYSLHECLPRSIFDGMAYGHPLIRNDCGGVDEQLIEGVNGWKVSIDDWQGFIDTIEEVLNKEKTSNARLRDMSKASVDIAKGFSDIKYRIIDDVMEAYADQGESGLSEEKPRLPQAEDDEKAPRLDFRVTRRDYGFSENHKYILLDAKDHTGLGENGENVTIMILSWNRSAATIRLLRSIEGHIPNFAGEILFVDNGSDDSELEEVRKSLNGLAFRSRVLKLDDNYGPGGGRNRGLAAVTKPWVLSLDSDMRFIRNPLPELENTVLSTGAHFINLSFLKEDGETIGGDGGFLDVTRTGDNTFVNPDSMYEYSRYDPGREDRVSIGTFLYGGASLFRKETHDIIGGFDEGMFIGFEDVDFSISLFKKGYKIANSGVVCLVHDHGKPQSEASKRSEEVRHSQQIHMESGEYFKDKNNLTIYHSNFEKWLDARADELGLHESGDEK